MYSLFVLYLYCIFKYVKFTKSFDLDDLDILQLNFFKFQTIWTYAKGVIQFIILSFVTTFFVSLIFNLNVFFIGNFI